MDSGGNGLSKYSSHLFTLADFYKIKIDAANTAYCPPVPSTTLESNMTNTLTTGTPTSSNVINPQTSNGQAVLSTSSMSASVMPSQIQSVTSSLPTRIVQTSQSSDPNISALSTPFSAQEGVTNSITDSSPMTSPATTASQPVASLSRLAGLKTPSSSRSSSQTTSKLISENVTASDSPFGIFKSEYFIYGASGFGALILSCLVHFIISRRRKQRADTEKSVTGNDQTAMRQINSNSTDMTQYTQTSMGTTMTSMQPEPTATAVNPIQGLVLPGNIQCNFRTDLKICSKLSEGGFGIVYLAEPKSNKLTGHGQKIVVKMAKISDFPNEDNLLFHQEVSLNEYFGGHPNIAKILGYTESPYCIILKFYPMGSLRDWLNKKQYGQRSKLLIRSFLSDISKGIATLHSKGVLHDDIKPENILLEVSAGPKGKIPVCVLTDFGLAQTVTDDILTVKRFKVVKPDGISFYYASPENFLEFNASGEDRTLVRAPPHVELRKDVYPVGVIAYELNTGRHPVF